MTGIICGQPGKSAKTGIIREATPLPEAPGMKQLLAIAHKRWSGKTAQ
ncbi:hypothetical protein [Dechloromonas sp.]|nr:hypothetical protein [Dechloromonas sp.]